MALVLDVCQFLRAQTELAGVFVSNRMPVPARPSAVIVTSSGGYKVNDVLSEKSIDVKVYAPDDLAADELAETVVAVLDGMNTTTIHDCSPLVLPADTVDPTTGAPIKFARFRVLES